VKLPYGLEHKVYDNILSYLDTLENPLDVSSIITAFFETLNSITMHHSTVAWFQHPDANPYDRPPHTVRPI